MSFRRDVRKLTSSAKWARIQEKFQENRQYETSYQKTSLLSTKEDCNTCLCKSNRDVAAEDSVNCRREITVLIDSKQNSQCKEMESDVAVKIDKSFKEDGEQLLNTVAGTECVLEIADKETSATKAFSEITEENVGLLFQSKSPLSKIVTEIAVSECLDDQKSDLSGAVSNAGVVENKFVTNYETSRALTVKCNQNIKTSRLKLQEISKPCDDDEISQKYSKTSSKPDKKFDGKIKRHISSEGHQKNVVFPRKSPAGIKSSHINCHVERRKMLRDSYPPKMSFRDRRKRSYYQRYFKPRETVRNLIHKFEVMSAKKLEETQNDDGQSAEQDNISSNDIHQSKDNNNCGEKTHPIKNWDDSGISEGEDSHSPKHIYQTINYRLIENYNRYLSEINAESCTLHESMLKSFPDCVPKHIYSNFPGRTHREIKRSRSKSPRPNLIVKKPVPLPRSCSSPHYLHISDCFSGNQYQQKEIKKQKYKNLSSKLTQSEEEWADISEEEKEVLSYSQKLANVSKRFYDLKFPSCSSETSNLYDCCSPTRQRFSYNDKCKNEDNSTGDSSWETLSLHQVEDDDDKSSTTSSEHHYEALNDFLIFEPGSDSSYRSDQQSTDEFIRESFNFLNTHSAEESDDVESPLVISTDSHSLKDSYVYNKKHNCRGKLPSSFDSRDSVTETILMYQELSTFRRSFSKKTIKNILKENSLESNKLKKQPLFSKSGKEILNFHVPWFSKTDNNQKQRSCERSPEQLNVDSPDFKEKRKNKYFTIPHPKKMSRSEQHLNSFTDIDKSRNCNSLTRARDNSPSLPRSKNTPEGSEASTCHESSGNESSLQSQSSSSTNMEGDRTSVVSCTSCADGGYICRKHLESSTNSSSSEESVNYARDKKPIDVNFVKVRKRVESTGSEHTYFQISELSQPLCGEEQPLGSHENDNSEDQSNSVFYCDLSPPELLSETHMSIEQLSSQKGGKKLWSDIPEVQKSGILTKMSAQELKLQEAIFNVAMFEATYLRLLETYQEHFVRSSSNSDGYSLCRIISWHEWHLVFSDSLPIIEVSRRLVADIEQRWDESYSSFDLSDILYENIKTHFQAYVKYCSNKPYRDRMLKVLMNTKPKFAEVTRYLEASAECQGFLLEEFLMLPAHHILDLLHLIEDIVHWLPLGSSKYGIYNEIMDLLRKLKLECEKGALQMERMEEMLLLAQQIIFKDCKPLSLISVSRWLLKRGEMTHLVCFSSNKRTFGKSVRWSKVSAYIFLFNDYLIVTKRRSDECYNVLDYCPKNIVHVEFIDDQKTSSNLRPPSGYKNLLHLTLWSNHKNKTVEMILSCPSESDMIRWGEALSSEMMESDSTERQDYCNVQCVRPYTANQGDELTLFETDVVKVLKKVGDGWYKGKRTKDGNVGWFPASCVTEDVHDFRTSHLSHGHKYSQVLPAGS